MLISGYASAFFFARRNRVTRSAFGCSRKPLLQFQKRARPMAGINFHIRHHEILGRPPYTGPAKSGCARISCNATCGDKKKSPALPGLLTNISIGSFRQLGDLMREPRYLSAGIVLVNDV